MRKIFTLNLNYYVNKHGDWKERKKLIAEAIEEHDPDIAVFQAACCDPEADKGINQAVQLAGILPEYRFRHFFTASRQSNGIQEGNALISKTAPSETGQFLLTLQPGAEDPVQRLISKAVFNFGAEPLTLFTAHFSWVAGQTKDNARETLAHIDPTSGKLLLVGDLNTDPKDKLLQPFKDSGFTDAWEKLKGEEKGFTFESDKPFTRIDYAWANSDLTLRLKDIQVVKKEMDGVRMSDHLGLLITLDL